MFHSFGEFGVPNNNIANFLNNTGLTTDNILGRVTDGNVSNIFGTIQTTGFGNANLFLMNPAGIVFGPAASLNVGGSVAFTTADYVRFADNGRFNATPNVLTDALLSTSPVAAYGFLASNPGPITVRGSQLTVQERQGLSFVGGNITIESGKLATDGDQPATLASSVNQINLASVASPGEVLIGTLGYVPNIDGQSFGALGSIQILDKAVINASGNGGGTVRIRGGRFVLDNSKIFANVTGPETVSNGVESIGGGIDIAVSQDATIQKGAVIGINVASTATPGLTYGGVQVKADRIIFLGIPGSALNFNNLRFTKITTNTEGGGHAGNVTLQATGNIELTNVVEISSSSGLDETGTGPSATLAQGNAGNVELTSMHGDILMNNGGRATQVASQLWNSHGNTGNVTASSPNGSIVMDGASLLTASFDSQGQIGAVEITAKNLWMKGGLVSNENLGPSKPGGITITLSGKLTMAADFSVPTPIPPYSFIVTSAFGPTGAPAGDITLTAKDIAVTQGSLISNGTFVSGPAGRLNIFADTIQLTSGSTIESGSTFAPRFGRLPQGFIPSGAAGTIAVTGLQEDPAASVLIDGAGSGIFSNSNGTGAAGDVVVNAKSVTLQNGGKISAETTGISSAATGGSINITATDHVTLTNGALITAGSTGSGNAGNILIDAGQKLMVQDSSITTEAMRASGGNINIKAIDLIQFTNGLISTSVFDNSGNAGNISIDPNAVVLQNSQIRSQAVFGDGGNITVITPFLVVDPTSTITASSQFGRNGKVTARSNLSGIVMQPESKPNQTQDLLQNRCIALAGGEQSTFILSGRDTIPAEPGGWLRSPISMEHWTGVSPEHASTLMVQSPSRRSKTWSAMITPKSEANVLSLRRLTPPGFLVRSFATAPTGCRS